MYYELKDDVLLFPIFGEFYLTDGTFGIALFSFFIVM